MWLENLSSQLRKVVNFWECARDGPAWRSREVIVWNCDHKAWMVLTIPRCWTCQSLGYLPRRAPDLGGTSPREASMLLSTKMNEIGDLENSFASDMEMQSLKISQFISCFVLFQYFLSMLHFFNFGMITYILCHYIFKVCDLFLTLIL